MVPHLVVAIRRSCGDPVSVEKRVSERTGKVSWRVIIWVGGKPAVSRTFHRRQDAEVFEREEYRRLERGEGLLDPVGAKRSVAWLSLIHISEPTRPY